MAKKIVLDAQVYGCINELCTNPTEVAVLSYIVTFTAFGDGFYAGEEQLAAEACCSLKTIRRTIRSLVERGLISSAEKKMKNRLTATFVAAKAVLDLLSKSINTDTKVSNVPSENDATSSKKHALKAHLYGRVNRLCKSPIEVLLLGYVTSFTLFGAGFYAGQARLAEECHCSPDTVQRAMCSLRKRGLIDIGAKKKNYSTTVYVATEVVLALIQSGQDNVSEGSNCGMEEVKMRSKKEEAKKQNPPISPRGDGERKPRASGSRAKKRALNYLRGSEKYDKESLRKMGISMGEEFYADDYEK